ncbi:MAG: hypothetical protein ACE5GE_03505 [Phycisphaerae bacterium]
MKSIGLPIWAALALILSPVPVAHAAGPNAVLEAVPGDAWGVVLVRNLADVDKKLMGFSQAINSPMAGMSPLMMAKGMLGLFAGVDDNEGLALVVMPMSSPEDFENKAALLIPTNNYDELLSTMQPAEAVEGISQVTFQGNPSFVAKKGKFAVFGPSADAVKAVVAGEGNVAKQMTPHQLERMGTDDLTLWVNLGAATQSEMVGGLLGMLEGMGAGSSAETIRAFQSAQISVRFGPKGIDLGFYGNAKPGTPMAEAIKGTKAPAGSLLAGLPAEDYILAAGSVTSAQGAKLLESYVDQASAGMAMTMDPEMAGAMSKLLGICKGLVGGIRSMGFSINALPEEAEGMVSATAVIGLDGAAPGFVKSIGELYNAATVELGEEHATKIKSALSFSADGERAAKLTLNAAELGADEEDLGIMTKVFGAEGLVFRFAAVDDKHVAVTFGGGQAHADAVAKLVQGGQAPLTADPGIQKMAASAPAKRVSETYFSASNLMGLAKRIGEAVGDPLPFELGPVESPVTVYSFVTPDGGSQGDLIVPAELIKAVMQAVMAQMGAGNAPPSSPPM